MHIDTIRTLPELMSLEKEWNDLLSQSASHVPFLRHEYLTAWWQGLGGGEWKGGELHIITARQEDGALLGIAPLFLPEKIDSEPALMLMGSVEISDYLDVITRQKDLPIFMDALLTHLDSEQMNGTHLLDWYNLLEDSPTIPAINAVADRKGWQVSQQPLQHCPYIPLPGDWEKYLSGIDKKQRHEIRRKMRRAEDYYQPVRWYIAQDSDTLEKNVDDFVDLMACDPDKALFCTPAMRAQFHHIARAAHLGGWLQLSFIEVNGEKAAGYLNFDYLDHIWVYNSGLDFRFSELSPGWVLLGYLLQWANENQKKSFDFMRGDEAYKYRFGAIDRRVVRLTMRK